MAPTPPRAAVSAIILGGDALLVLRRQPTLRHFPGYFAFPGGKVEEGDEAHAPSALADLGIDPRRLGALTRELREETGLDLARLAADGDLLELREVAFAQTPPMVREGFATHFYRLRLRGRPPLDVDPREHADAAWASIEDWGSAWQLGLLLLAPPTLHALADLAENPDAPRLQRVDRLDGSDDGRQLELQPVIGVHQLPVRSRTLPPASHTNAWLLGDEDAFRLLVDPSPADESAFEALWQQVQGRFDLVFLTHHHPDHRERADALARRAGVPLAMSADTQARIAATQPAFFDGLETWIHAEGEIVTRWNGHLVRALAVPGHDAGQLALMPENRAWCLVGDLIQGIGTVVIAPPEGDMAAYFASLQRIIDLDPKVVLPSHGSALGGTHYLAQALAHRREREAQILELHRRGLDEDALLATIYRDVPPGVLTLARLTIRSHLAKLRAEGAIDAT